MDCGDLVLGRRELHLRVPLTSSRECIPGGAAALHPVFTYQFFFGSSNLALSIQDPYSVPYTRSLLPPPCSCNQRNEPESEKLLLLYHYK